MEAYTPEYVSRKFSEISPDLRLKANAVFNANIQPCNRQAFLEMYHRYDDYYVALLEHWMGVR